MSARLTDDEYDSLFFSGREITTAVEAIIAARELAAVEAFRTEAVAAIEANRDECRRLMGYEPRVTATFGECARLVRDIKEKA